MGNMSKIMEILMSLGFVIHPSKSKTIEYLRFVINTEDMTIRLTYAKKIVIFNMCTSLCSTNICSTRDVAKLLGKFSGSLITVKMRRLHYRSLERANVKKVEASRGNFDKTTVLDGQSKFDILWRRDNIINSLSQIIQGNPTTHIHTDASWYGWGISCNSETCGGQYSIAEQEIHKNILQLKTACFGMKSF